MLHTLYIGLGSNLGDRQSHILEALRIVGLTIGPVEAVSTLMESEPWGFQSQNRFLNAAARIRTSLSPLQCLRQTQHIEHMMGRRGKSIQATYHDRPIDIDLLHYDKLELHTPELTLPHPLIAQREFVRIPLSEVQGSD